MCSDAAKVKRPINICILLNSFYTDYLDIAANVFLFIYFLINEHTHAHLQISRAGELGEDVMDINLWYPPVFT